MENIQHILNEFESVSLSEMETVKLLDRNESKFLLNLDRLPELLLRAQEQYRVLNVTGFQIIPYQTRYFDSPEFDFYLAHHNGKLNRHKVRHRYYPLTGEGFLEIKFRLNTGRTRKVRFPLAQLELPLKQEATNFLFNHLGSSASRLLPNVQVNYNRISLVSKQHAERITIDTGLNAAVEGRTRNFGDLAIVEIKRSARQDSTLLNSLKEMRVKELGLSKYCLAIASLYTGIKKNNFKELILTVQQFQPALSTMIR